MTPLEREYVTARVAYEQAVDRGDGPVAIAQHLELFSGLARKLQVCERDPRDAAAYVRCEDEVARNVAEFRRHRTWRTR